jgi:uncharacterized protein (DUF1800 family)
MEDVEIRPETGVPSLQPFEGTLGFERAKHLLNRCLFGARLSEINFMKNKTASEAVDYLLREPLPLLSLPLGVKADDVEIQVGTTWVNTKYNGTYNSQRLYSYRAWWIGRLLNMELSVAEKMALFWHNHFVIETDVVSNTNFNYKYNLLLYSQAMGNFKKLTEDMTVNVGMLTYLDGVKNTSGSPNENFARELFELFTIGKGPLIEPGNYTNYTEADIREAAKVLTGWRTNSTTDLSYFDATKHDKTDKTFSSAFGNKVIPNSNENEYKELISMIFQKKETAKYLARKLYRWFVYYRINEETEQNIIVPLADILYNNNYEIKPVLKTLLCSLHFYDDNLRGAMIKNPLEFSAGIFLQFEILRPATAAYIPGYSFWNWIYSQCVLQNLEIGDPPDVAGWPAWYLAPMFNELWINSATIPNRNNFVKYVVQTGIKTTEMPEKVIVDPFKVANLADNPQDINNLVGTLAGLLFPVTAPASMIAGLKEVLIPGLPDYEWTVEWNKYINNPSDANQKKAVGNSLTALIMKMVSMAEFHLI